MQGEGGVDSVRCFAKGGGGGLIALGALQRGGGGYSVRCFA